MTTRKKSGSKGNVSPWTAAEDQALLKLVQKYGFRWSEISVAMSAIENVSRYGKQCRERWCNHVNPSIKRGEWTKEEDDTIVRMQALLGNSWALIAKCLNGRTENSVKNRFISLVNKRVRKLATEDDSTVDSDGCYDESTQAKLAEGETSFQDGTTPQSTPSQSQEASHNVGPRQRTLDVRSAPLLHSFEPSQVLVSSTDSEAMWMDREPSTSSSYSSVKKRRNPPSKSVKASHKKRMMMGLTENNKGSSLAIVEHKPPPSSLNDVPGVINACGMHIASGEGVKGASRGGGLAGNSPPHHAYMMDGSKLQLVIHQEFSNNMHMSNNLSFDNRNEYQNQFLQQNRNTPLFSYIPVPGYYEEQNLAFKNLLHTSKWLSAEELGGHYMIGGTNHLTINGREGDYMSHLHMNHPDYLYHPPGMAIFPPRGVYTPPCAGPCIQDYCRNLHQPQVLPNIKAFDNREIDGMNSFVYSPHFEDSERFQEKSAGGASSEGLHIPVDYAHTLRGRSDKEEASFPKALPFSTADDTLRRCVERHIPSIPESYHPLTHIGENAYPIKRHTWRHSETPRIVSSLPNLSLQSDLIFKVNADSQMVASHTFLPLQDAEQRILQQPFTKSSHLPDDIQQPLPQKIGGVSLKTLPCEDSLLQEAGEMGHYTVQCSCASPCRESSEKSAPQY